MKSRTLDGKAIYGYIYRRSYAEAKRAQMEARAAGVIVRKGTGCALPKSLETYLTAWLQSVQTSIKKSTFSNYSGLIYRHILPELGSFPVEQITSELIQKYVDRRLEAGRLDGKGGLSVKTVKDIVGLLKHSLKPVGVTLQIHLPRYSPPKLKILTMEDQARLVTAAKASGSREGIGVLLSLFTGIRIGELCALKWCDIDFQKGILRIWHTLQRIESWDAGNSKTVIDIGTPKSDCSMRDIPIPSFLLAIISEQKSDDKEDDYILSGCGCCVEPRCCQYRFKKLLQSTGINVNFHALRHTFATRCVELGVDAKTLSDILGHANVNITLNRYVHPNFEHRKECMEKLSIAF